MNFIIGFEDILKSYGISKYKIEMVRSAYKISCERKNILIKKFNSHKKLMNTYRILNSLKLHGFKNTYQVFCNQQGNFYFKIDRKFYAFFNWIDGREVNLKKLSEISQCTNLVYRFHECVKDMDSNDIDLKDQSNWIEKFYKDINNLIKIESIILSKKYLEEVDKVYLINIGKAIDKITYIIQWLKDMDFLNYSINNKIICHNSLYYQNFIKKNNSVYMIDFGGICFNNRVYDIAKFARRVFYKNNFNFNILNNIYEIYNKYYEFNDFEKKLFYKYLEYPYKFVRFGNKFYLKNKNINKNTLLNKINKYTDYELNFSRCYNFK